MRGMAWRCGWVILAGLGITACGKKDATPSGTPMPSLPGHLSVVSGNKGKTGVADSDVAARGSGVPDGYLVQMDMPNARVTDVAYQADGSGRWSVQTGPAHILYSLKDTTRKVYSVTATIQQLVKPAHPEAYGVFIGGSSLNVPAKQQYTYFLVRGDGEYMVKVRNGLKTRTVTDWTAHPSIPQQDTAGKAIYGIKIDVDGKTAKVSVNGKPVTTILAKSGPLEG